MQVIDTIIAIATPIGRAGVAILRLSGPSAYRIALILTKKKDLIQRKAIYTSFYDKENNMIDKGIVLYFKGPMSFTGEDVIEFHAHGAPVLLDHLMKEAVFLGARLARAGEFSERAFLNNKIDLVEAEAIADLIQAQTLAAARMAFRSLQGDFSQKIHALNEKIIYLRTYVEAFLDFPDEEIDFLAQNKVLTLLQELLHQLDAIIKSANQGVLLQEGISIVIAGRPNAGKSTLINNLAGKEVAIVTPVAGTTRDVMREHILIGELPVHIIDTAGLRDSNDLIEREGIKRAWKEVKEADCVLMLIDINGKEESLSFFNEIKEKLPAGASFIKVFNKIDNLTKEIHRESDAVYLSAKTGEGLEELKRKIQERVGFQREEGAFLARRRHLDALHKAHLLLKGDKSLGTLPPLELLAEDLRLAHQSLCEITGEFSSDDLLGKIFSSFCIGK